MTYSLPLWKPGEGWSVELMDAQGKVLSTVPPTPEQAAWLAAHPVEALDMRAEWELTVNRNLLQDPAVIEALRNIRRLRNS